MKPLPEQLGGVGKMCSFGESVSMTPLQLGAMVSAIANGGTLYYLAASDVAGRRLPTSSRGSSGTLDIASADSGNYPMAWLGAVQYGTARSLRLNFNEEEILGKTGTCSHAGTRFGWFASYANTSVGRIVVVDLPAGRPSDLWPQGCRNCRTHVSQLV
jgi:penicillin-binding protein 2